MSINPHKNTDQSILFQNHQIPTFGCCYTYLQITHDNNRNTTSQRCRFYSEPKESKTRKIDLTIAKRRRSLVKNEEDKQSTARKQRLQTLSSEAKKISQHGKVTLTINSKLTTQKSSLKTSKVSFNQDIEVSSFKNNQIVSRIKNTNPSNYPLLQIKYPQKQDLDPFKLISEISIVEQEFVSQGSETLRAFNFITQLQTNENKSQVPKLCQTKLPNFLQQKYSHFQLTQGTNQARTGRKQFVL